MLKKIMALLLLMAFANTLMAQSQEDRIAALENKVKELQESKIAGKTKSGDFITFYGFARMDAMWVNGNANTIGGNAIYRWSNPDNVGSDNSQFGITARNSRIGFDIVGPKTDTLSSSAKFEMDFYGLGSETSNAPRMRHAYVKLDMPENQFSILAGQTWDVMAPVLPPTVDFSVLWWQGNIGMRRPQVRLTQGISINDNTSLKLEGAIARNIGSLNNYNGIDSGTAQGAPSFQGRASITTPIFNGLKSTMGVSGHYGKEEYDTTVTKDKFDSWTMAFDMTVPITSSTKVTGEMYSGSNCGEYAGGIGNKLNSTNDGEVDAMGGWVAISHSFNPQFSVAAGYGIDTVDADHISATSMQSNQTTFANITYSPLPRTSAGIEIAHNKTEYMDYNNGQNVRLSMFMQLSF